MFIFKPEDFIEMARESDHGYPMNRAIHSANLANTRLQNLINQGIVDCKQIKKFETIVELKPRKKLYKWAYKFQEGGRWIEHAEFFENEVQLKKSFTKVKELWAMRLDYATIEEK